MRRLMIFTLLLVGLAAPLPAREPGQKTALYQSINQRDAQTWEAVSYTHLTLPTILLV